ncbi:MAG: hypothetical protein HDS35_07360 [Bacteroides sp.]|nr:hypothetical protein [Bacteroides sp.]
MKHQLYLTGLFLMTTSSIFAQSYFDDDIYYNPDKQQKTNAVKKQKKQSNYIANMADMDVDTYNRRNQYYLSPIDTIGSGVENAEDFVYTQQIQKFYNPTIVVDNADVLSDVLANAYGNVEIVINDNGLPVFTPYYSYGWPYYNRWGWNVGSWGWSMSFYDPWYAWNWGPSWGWGPGWGYGPSWAWGPSWSWGPSWGWGPGWGYGPGWGGYPPMANWRPNGNRPVAPAPGWGGNHRPGVGGGNAGLAHRVPSNGSNGMRPGTSTGRPATNNHRPGVTGNHVATIPASGMSSGRPGGTGVVNNNGKWEYVNGGHRVPAGTVTNNGNSTNGSNRRPGTMSTGSNKQPNNTNNSYNNRNNSNSNRNNYNTNSNSTNSNRSFNTGRSGSYNRGGSFGGGARGTGGRSSGGGRRR